MSVLGDSERCLVCNAPAGACSHSKSKITSGNCYEGHDIVEQKQLFNMGSSTTSMHYPVKMVLCIDKVFWLLSEDLLRVVDPVSRKMLLESGIHRPVGFAPGKEGHVYVATWDSGLLNYTKEKCVGRIDEKECVGISGNHKMLFVLFLRQGLYHLHSYKDEKEEGREILTIPKTYTVRGLQTSDGKPLVVVTSCDDQPGSPSVKYLGVVNGQCYLHINAEFSIGATDGDFLVVTNKERALLGKIENHKWMELFEVFVKNGKLLTQIPQPWMFGNDDEVVVKEDDGWSVVTVKPPEADLGVPAEAPIAEVEQSDAETQSTSIIKQDTTCSDEEPQDDNLPWTVLTATAIKLDVHQVEFFVTVVDKKGSHEMEKYIVPL